MGICMAILWLEHNFRVVGGFVKLFGTEMPFEVPFCTRQERCFDKVQGLILSPLYARLIKQRNLGLMISDPF